MKHLFQFVLCLILCFSCGSRTKPALTTNSDVLPSTSLTHQQSESITEKYWKLIELNGNPIDEEKLNRPAFITLKNEENRVTGNGGCNTLAGSYELDAVAKRLKFSKMITTQMACLNMEVEFEMNKVLEMVDNYALSPDGKFLSLHRARMAPLARFEIVYME